MFTRFQATVSDWAGWQHPRTIYRRRPRADAPTDGIFAARRSISAAKWFVLPFLIFFLGALLNVIVQVALSGL